MNLKSFFWQVFLAIAILCIGVLFLAEYLRAVMDDHNMVMFISIISALAGGFFMAYRLSHPMRALRDYLGNMAAGHLGSKFDELKTEVTEIHELARAMQKIRDQLQERIYIISNQKSEQDALLASMIEGVIAVDHDYHIMHMNRAASSILGIPSSVGTGTTLHEFVRIPEILTLVESAMQSNEMTESDIEVPGAKARFLQVHSSPMKMEQAHIGVVLVISDVTRIRELEGMRRNFVANVSHELRTPLTSIQGFAETLLNPTVKDPEEIKNFLQIIQRHASRLGRIIEDILTLSRIERDSEDAQIELRPEKLKPSLVSSVELCAVKANNKKIKLSLKCDDNLKVAMDPYLLEQAVINLIDNAIRYSDEGQSVDVEAVGENEYVLIHVADHGMGIAEKQLPRIFERFYRVDKARSREVGGTGLGLSIVKHISIAHKGKVEVKSEVGKGSVFTIRLPALTI